MVLIKVVGVPICSLAGTPAVVWPWKLGASCSVADSDVEPRQVSKLKEMGLEPG